MILLFDNFTVKVALYVEMWTITLLLLLPDEVRLVLFPYSRRMLEEQLVGSHWLLNKRVEAIPKEARVKYLLEGRLYIALVLFAMSLALGG
jgi:hypothetical protein